MKKLPLGIKILIIAFALEFIGYLSSFDKVFKFGLYMVILKLIILVLFLCAVIGLFKLKKWGRRFAVACLVIEGLGAAISFVKNFIVGFKDGFAKSTGMAIESSTVLYILAIILAILIVGGIVYLLSKYLYQEKMKTIFS
ncbi:MAG: hypothetical protein ABIH18_08400 [Candidatus Omnitrophota bacterium]